MCWNVGKKPARKAKLVSVNTVEGLGADARIAIGASASARQVLGIALAAIHSGLTGARPGGGLLKSWHGFANEFIAACCAAAAVPVGTGATRNGGPVDVKTAIGKFYAKTVR